MVSFPTDQFLLPGEKLAEFEIEYTRSYMPFEKISFKVDCTFEFSVNSTSSPIQRCPITVIIREEKLFVVTVTQFRPSQVKSIQIIIKV